MANIKIHDLYVIEDNPIIAVNDDQFQKLEGGEGIISRINASDINQQSVLADFNQNLNNLVFNLRNQIGTTISGTRGLVNEELNML